MRFSTLSIWKGHTVVFWGILAMIVGWFLLPWLLFDDGSFHVLLCYYLWNFNWLFQNIHWLGRCDVLHNCWAAHILHLYFWLDLFKFFGFTLLEFQSFGRLRKLWGNAIRTIHLFSPLNLGLSFLRRANTVAYAVTYTVATVAVAAMAVTAMAVTMVMVITATLRGVARATTFRSFLKRIQWQFLFHFFFVLKFHKDVG